MIQENTIDVSGWKKIWNLKEADEIQLNSESVKDVFMELKRLDGNDTIGNGIMYESFLTQYQNLKKECMSVGEAPLRSVFEVGCGSGPFLMLFENDNVKVGGLDYSEVLIRTARKVLKNPIELYCDEAIDLKTEYKYDAVYSNSAFEYFQDEEYALQVLEKMFCKANYSIAILDVHDEDFKEEYMAYRKSIIENYEEKYRNLSKKFYSKVFFLKFAKRHKMDIKFTECKLKGYWNSKFVYDVYMFKNDSI